MNKFNIKWYKIDIFIFFKCCRSRYQRYYSLFSSFW